MLISRQIAALGVWSNDQSEIRSEVDFLRFALLG